MNVTPPCPASMAVASAWMPVLALRAKLMRSDCLACASTSGSDAALNLLLATSTWGAAAMIMTGEKSLTGSYGTCG
ncbi:Uncharacterised protein [Bordetella pertussis]|nr:Uncharacterised protein [Bordetella pertussis]